MGGEALWAPGVEVKIEILMAGAILVLGMEVVHQERMKRDYKYIIAMMQSRITGLEQDLGVED